MRLSWNEIRVRAGDFAREWADAAYEKGETQSFYNAFFEIFGVQRRTVARYEEHVRRLDNTSGFIDLFWPRVLLVEQKSAGRDLTAAREQAGTYFDALPERDRPRYQLLCDFQTFELLDRDEREETRFALADLPRHVEKFGFIIGVQRRTFRDQDPVNIEASELIARLHDALEASGYDGHDLERFLVRTVFCLFADDTGIFEPRDIFLQFIEERTAADGADLGPWMARLFQVLNTPPNRRSRALDEDLARFPHVNGDLFAEPLRIPDFDAAMRQVLLDAGQFDWTAISPAIFGALFQSVMEPADRRAQGAHYTTEKNILKVIEPLFLDDLRAEFRRLQARRDGRSMADLRKFRDKLGTLRLFDPACGCGNFLIIAYRELRTLEIDVLREMALRRVQPLEGARPPRIGFVATNSITQGEQVAQLWPLLLDHRRLEIAFAHRTFAWGSDARGKAHVHVVIIGLDAADHAPRDRRLFTYEDISGEPLEGRHVVITPYLVDGVALVNPHLVVREEGSPVNGMRQLITGSKPIDDGHYIFKVEERSALLESEPDAAMFLRPFVGAREYLRGGERWILALHDAAPAALARLPLVRERIAAVRAYRRASKSKPTQQLADTPTLYHVNVLPTDPFLVIPQVSSERREYVPIGWLEPPTIPSDKLRLLPNATLADFALLTSAMHMAWMRAVTGRMKSDYMYSVGVVYNTFPLPPGFADTDTSALEPLGQAVVDARATHAGATLADLYDPDLMPPNLRRAHHALDRAVDRLYRRQRFTSERERVEYLFALYERMQAPLAAVAAKPRTRRRRRVT